MPNDQDNGNMNVSDQVNKDAKQLAEGARKAVEAGKAIAKAVSGDYVGAAKSAVSAGAVQFIVGASAVMLCVFLGFFSLVPSVLFAPVEKAANTLSDWSSKFIAILKDPINEIEGTILNDLYAKLTGADEDYNIDENSVMIFNDTERGTGIGLGGSSFSGGNIVSGSGSVPANLSPGEEIILPDGKGDIHTVTYWDNIRWTKTASTGKTIYALGGDISSVGGVAGGCISYQNGFVCYGDWYAVAMTSTFGHPGSMLFIVQDDGLVYPVMIADEASQVAFNNGYTFDDNPADKWGHNYGGQCCVTEFQLQKSSGAASAVTLQPALNCNIDKAIYVGSIYDSENSKQYITDVSKALSDLGISTNKFLDIHGNISTGTISAGGGYNSLSGVLAATDIKDVVFYGDSWFDNPTFDAEWGADNTVKAKTSAWAQYFMEEGDMPLDIEDKIVAVNGASAVYVQMGLSDWQFDGTSLEDTYYKKMLDKLGTVYRNIPIYVARCSNTTSEYPATAGSDLSVRVSNLNTFISDYCDNNEGYYYVDTVASLQDENGWLNTEYSADSIHLNEAGYNIWFENLKKVLAGSEGKSGTGSSSSELYNSTSFFDPADSATRAETATLQLMFDKTKERYKERHEMLIEAINDDFKKKKSRDSYATMTIVGSDFSTTYLDCAKLVSLYTVQTDGELASDGFVSYLKWLGNKKFITWFDSESTEKKYSNKHNDGRDWSAWDAATPERWRGEMLPQDEYYVMKKDIIDGLYKEENYPYTSALQELIYVEPEIGITPVTIVTKEATDTSPAETVTSYLYTYTIKTRTLDELAEFVNLDFDQPDDSEATPRADAFKDLYDTTIKYFHIGNGSSRSGSGNGSDIIRVALGEVGYKEKASNYMLDSFDANAGDGNYTKYGAWYGPGWNPNPWCAMFVSWCANECGYIESGVIPKAAACEVVWSWYEERGLTHLASDSSYTPQPGDLVLRGPGDHIEIVEKYEDGVLWTIGGNTGAGEGVISEGSGVYNKKYSNPSSSWYGYCSPEYPIISTGTGLGDLCFAFETGSQTLGQYNVWMCENIGDSGGNNYGAMSATSSSGSASSLLSYIKEHSTNFAEKFKGLDVGNPGTVDDVWRNTNWTESETAEMEMLQRDWTVQTYLQPIISTSEFFYLGRSWALKEMTISRSVQNGVGGAKTMLRKSGIKESMSDEEILETVYNYEANNITTSGGYTAAVRSRMKLELELAKTFLGKTEP